MGALPFPVPDQNDPRQDLIVALKGLTAESQLNRAELVAATRATKELTNGLASQRAKEQAGDTRGAGPAGGGMGIKKGIAGGYAAFQAVGGLLNTASTLGNIANNSSIGGAQKGEEFAKSIPIIGQFVGAMQNFRDAMENTEDRIRQATKSQKRHEFHQNQHAEMGGIVLQADAAEGLHAHRRNALLGLKQTPEGNHDTSTLAGQQAFEAEQRRLPGLDAIRKAEAEVEGARNALQHAQQGQNIVRDRARAADRKLESKKHFANQAEDDNWHNRGKGRNTAGRIEASLEVQKAAKEVLVEENLLLKAEEATRERNLSLAQKESGLAKARIASQKEELAILQDKGQRLQSNAQRLGMMNKGERMQGLNAWRVVKKHGLENVAPQIRDMAARFAPDDIRKRAEKFGENTEEHKVARKEGAFGMDVEKIADNKAEQKKARVDIKTKIILDEQVLADKIVEALRKGFGDVIASVERKQDAERANRKAGDNVKHAAGR